MFVEIVKVVGILIGIKIIKMYIMLELKFNEMFY